MRWLAKARISRATIATLAVLVWLIASNHCLLGLIAQPLHTAGAMAHCPAHCSKADGKPLSQSGMLACCQGLLSSDLDAGREKVSFGSLVFAIQLLVIGLFVFPKVQKRILPSIEYDTGPPSPDFLVETVLRRSLCENAPPGLS